jgi:5'-methylthioadenosine phosphorylase
MTQKVLGIIGGSGLYEIEGLQNIEKHNVQTPFGDPSGAFMSGDLHGCKLFFVPRHGYNHQFTPSEVNYRANVYGMKKLGVEYILSVSAVGSLKEEIPPGDMVLPDQFFDRTKDRNATFFGDGIVAHVPFGQPICKKLQDKIKQACDRVGAKTHVGGTYVNMEGPMFSTKAESMFYRSIGASIIGMTNLTEAKLAREAEMSYATLALSTDYDCWREGEEDVNALGVLEVMKKNVETAKKIIAELAKDMCEGPSPFKGVLKKSVLPFDHAPAETREKLSLLLQDL